MFPNAFPFDTWVEKRHSTSICSRPFRKPSPAAFLSPALVRSLPHSIDSLFHLIKQSSVSIPPLTSRNVKLESSRPFFIFLICPLSLMEPERSASRRANRLKSAGGIKGKLPHVTSPTKAFSRTMQEFYHTYCLIVNCMSFSGSFKCLVAFRKCLGMSKYVKVNIVPGSFLQERESFFSTSSRQVFPAQAGAKALFVLPSCSLLLWED